MHFNMLYLFKHIKVGNSILSGVLAIRQHTKTRADLRTAKNIYVSGEDYKFEISSSNQLREFKKHMDMSGSTYEIKSIPELRKEILTNIFSNIEDNTTDNISTKQLRWKDGLIKINISGDTGYESSELEEKLLSFIQQHFKVSK
jgi:hypothetical protein